MRMKIPCTVRLLCQILLQSTKRQESDVFLHTVGAVSAGAGAGAGIAYLCGGGYEEVIHTVVNALAIVSGIVCDGAKASCAAKIASAVDAGILGYNMYKRGQQFYGGDGIVTRGVEETIQNVGRLGKQGMKETNEEIIKIMVGE